MTAAEVEHDPDQPGTAPNDSLDTRTLGLSIALTTLSLLIYGWSFVFLAERWNDPENQHGYLVLPVAAVIMWLRRARLDLDRVRPQFVLGMVALVGSLVLRHALYSLNEQLAEAGTVTFVLGSLVLAFGGWRTLIWAAPVLVLTFLMLPMPYDLSVKLALPLQTVATIGSCWVLQTFGLPAIAEGHTIIIESYQLEVAQACSGLRMLQTFTFLIAAVVLVVDRPIWEKACLVLSIVPISLISNIIRISVTAWCYQNSELDFMINFIGWFGYDSIFKFTHDFAGYFMMPIALALVWLELTILEFVVPEHDSA